MNNMIDIHSHIIPSIDDGSRSFEESIHILEKLSSLGFSKVVLTPHYIVSTPYVSSVSDNKSKLNELQKNTDIELFLGNEVFACMEMVDYLKQGKMATINDSRYVLFELPRNSKINDLNELIFQLQVKDYKPILAHPERYQFLKDKKIIDDLLLHGVYFEVNFESITGKYGKDAKKIAKYLLKSHKFHFLATDIHHEDSEFFKNFKKIKKKIIRIIGKDYFKKVTYTNQFAVLENSDII